MYGNDSEPSRIYSYGAEAPTQHAEAVVEQMRLAHAYKNALVAQEIERRARSRALMAQFDPEYLVLLDALEAAREAYDDALGDLRGTNQRARRRAASAAQREAIRAAGAARKAAADAEKARRQALWANRAFLAQQDAIERWSAAECRRLRAASGCHWGTYLTVEKDLGGKRKGRPPRFKPWRGEGKVAVQIQHGQAVEEWLRFGHGQLRVEVDPPPPPGSSRRKQLRRPARLSVRIGSDERRRPVWAVIPFTLHRPMPADAKIKWVTLFRVKVATHYKWRVQFVLSRPDDWPRPADTAADGVVGVDLGWRLRPDGSLRVAYWHGSDGREGELTLSARDAGRWTRSWTLRSTRDRNFDAIRDRLAGWLRGRPAGTLPGWLVERTERLPQWRSTARLAGVVVHWRGNRFAGDEEVFDALEAWRRQDKHLYEWEANQIAKAVRWRDDLYRRFAARLRRSYATAVVEKIDWRDLTRRPRPESEDVTLNGVPRRRQVAAVGRLCQFIREAMDHRAAPPEFTTMTCHLCGQVDDFDRTRLDHQCSGCGETWDQDRNAAVNLLRAGQAMAAAGG